MRADARRNYERLLTTARAAFIEHGTAASLEDIARRAEVGIGTLYRHFPTRESLLEALLRERWDALGAQARALLASPSPAEALAELMRAFATHATTYQGLTPALMATLRDAESELYASCHAMRAAGEQLLRRAQASGAVRADIDAIDVFVLVNAIAWATEQVPDGAERVDRLLSLVMDGLSEP
jgi:AcrR family transcriptional regulator